MRLVNGRRGEAGGGVLDSGTAPRTPGPLRTQRGAKKKRKKVIRRRAHLSYLRLCPNKHIIANISAELQEEYPGDWLCIYTPLAEREQGRLP